MKPLDFYFGKEQTYIKHFIFERYLEEVAIKIGMRYGEFVLVDGFSGPWRSAGQGFDDTSFMIAVEQLRRAQNIVRSKNSKFKVRCLFIEKEQKAYEDLSRALEGQKHIEAETVNGPFEENIENIRSFVGNSFLFLFVDPTSWQGFGLAEMKPVMKLRGEILINFMYDHINRFIEAKDPAIALQMNKLMGRDDWRIEFERKMALGVGREEAILETYKEQLQNIGGYKFVKSIRVMKPLFDRSYFHLIYGTQALPGIEAFSRVEKKAAEEQNLVRGRIKDIEKLNKTNQVPMFASDEIPIRQKWFDIERGSALMRAEDIFQQILKTKKSILFDKILGRLLQLPLVWDADVKDLIRRYEANGKVVVDGKKPGQRVPKYGNKIVWTSQS